MADSDLANLSDQLALGAVLLYVVAMVGYALDLGFGLRRRQREQAEQPAKVLVGAAVDAGGSSAVAAAEAAEESESGAEEGGGRGKTDWGRFAVLITVLGWGAHLGTLVTRGWAAEHWPWGNMYEFLTAIAFAAVTAYLVVLARYRARFLGAFVMIAAVLALGVATIWLYTPVGPLVPALRSYWIAIHVTAAIIASGLFTLAGVAGVLYLVRGDGLSRLPSREVLEKAVHRAVIFAFPLWTFAVIAGALWADRAWGRYWGWDPKEVWSFITWVAYAAYLHAKATAGWRGRAAVIVQLVAFGCLLFNLIGVNIFIDGLHSYADVD